MTHNSGFIPAHALKAAQELKRLQNPAYRHKRQLTPPEAYALEISRLKRMMLAHEADLDPHHDLNSAIRTYAPQLSNHKGKCKLNRARSLGRMTSYK